MLLDKNGPKEYQVPGITKENRQGKKENQRKKRKMKQKQTLCAQGAGRVPRGQGCCLLVRPVLWCVQLMDNKMTTKNARRRTSQDKGGDKAEKTGVDRNEVVGFRWICICVVFRGDPVSYRMIYRDISWSHIPYHVISQDTTYRDVVSISRIFRTNIEISYLVELFLDTERIPNTIFCPARCSKYGAQDS